MADKLMYNTSQIMIHKIAPSVDLNNLYKRLNNQLIEPTKVPKVVQPTIKNMLS